MSVLSAPKALYKAQQAKKKMPQIQAASEGDVIAILLNGLNEIVETEVDVNAIATEFGLDTAVVQRLGEKISNDIKKAFADAKEQIEQQLISSTSLEDLKGLLG